MVKVHNAKLTEIEKAVREGVRDTAKDVLKVAKELAPKDTRALVRSGKIRVNDMEVTVSFTAPHAYLQHERLDYDHPNGGEAKYLEKAVDIVGAEKAIIAGVTARLRRG